jgi:hypothetical protein
MHVDSALPPGPRVRPRPTGLAPRRRAEPPRTVIAVETIGYLVARSDFSGRIHSVFAQACNVVRSGTLLTVCRGSAGNGPLALRLADGGPADLRELFEPGERVGGSARCLQSARAELRWAQATVWRPTERPASLDLARIGLRLRQAESSLAQFRHDRPSIVDGAGAPAVAALRESCRTLDGAPAKLLVERLIGWGEGLTPAGDDFLVGLLAGLDALVGGDPLHRFRAAAAASVVAGLARTTAVSAHYLRLAAAGHYGEPLVNLRDTLLAEPRDTAVDAALRAALAVGATSGADTVGGLLAGLAAWAAPQAASATS